ncbi:MAG: hemolysin III family protein [Microthrixaceae bacterium]
MHDATTDGHDAIVERGTARPVRMVGAYGPKPVWRGRIHEGAFFVSVPAGLWLLAGATSTAARVAVAIYWASMTGLYGTSASYHLFARSERAVTWMRRADHSMIFVLIAGSYTPFCLLVLPRVWGIPMLVVVWVVALAGIIMKMVRVSAGSSRTGSWLYVVMGWVAVVTLPQLLDQLGPARMVLMIAGGAMYTVGAVILGKRWFNMSPAVFGYHEVFHALTVAAGACHFVLIAMVVKGGVGV